MLLVSLLSNIINIRDGDKNKIFSNFLMKIENKLSQRVELASDRKNSIDLSQFKRTIKNTDIQLRLVIMHASLDTDIRGGIERGKLSTRDRRVCSDSSFRFPRK